MFLQEPITRELGEELKQTISPNVKEIVNQLIHEMRKKFIGRVFYCLYTKKIYSVRYFQKVSFKISAYTL
jgi:hypothetical protein